MFYLYTDGKGNFANITISKKLDPCFKVSITRKLDRCSYWTSRKEARSWEKYVNKQQPEFKLVQAVLKIML